MGAVNGDDGVCLGPVSVGTEPLVTAIEFGRLFIIPATLDRTDIAREVRATARQRLIQL